MSDSDGTAGSRNSSTPGSRRRRADARAGLTVDEVSAGVRSAGSVWTTATRSVAAAAQGSKPSSLRTSVTNGGQAQGQRLMVGAANYVEQRLLISAQPAP